ncbi:MAG: type II secretion system major pseudopilin GspG [Hyphomonadaceae bacterium]|nr:type II secretion system major pseudopilin GspG [Hyphomonadaceae bacterium]
MDLKGKQRAAEGRKGSLAFTLTEMLVVLAILGLIAAIVGPRLFNRLDDAKRRTARLQISNLAASVDLFRIDVGRLPTDEEGLTALVEAPDDGAEWLGPYLAKDRLPLDPWGRAYAFRRSGEAFEILSYGADGRPGGEGAGRDIVSGGGEAAARPPS